MQIILIICAVSIATFSGFYGQRSGYSFWRQFITGLIASYGILSIVLKLITEYF